MISIHGRAWETMHIELWEHELSQPDYYNYFLEEVTREEVKA